MPVYTVQTNFTTGEIAPGMDARLDVTKYHNAAELLWNVVAVPLGGVSRRAGTYFIHEVLDSTKRTYLVPFVFNQAQAYVLELSPGHLRIYRDRAILNGEATGAGPIDLTTPWTADELPELRWAQSGDVLYFTHSHHPVQKLLRIRPQYWELRTVNFYPTPSIEAPYVPNATLTPGTGATVAGTEGVTFTVGTGFTFLAGDVNKFLSAGAGRALIRTVGTGGSTITADIIDAFSSTAAIAPGGWSILGSPASDITLSAKSPLRARVTVTATVDSFRSADVHSFIRGNTGLLRIMRVDSATSVSADIVTEPSATGPILGGSWTLEVPSWSSARGYPGVVTFFEQRSMWAASLAEPLTVWGSVTGDFENLALGPNDDDAVDFALATGDFDRIRSMLPLRVLLIHTPGGEFQLHGGGDSPLTPTSVKSVQETAIGGDADVGPVLVGKSALFVQRGKTRLMEQQYDFVTDSIQATDLTILAEHLFSHGSGIVRMAKQSIPLAYVYVVRGDGFMGVCAHHRMEHVAAWTRFITGPAQDLSDGLYEDVCVIPNSCGNGDEVWCIVRRQMADGTYKRYVEVFDGTLNTDCALVAEGSALTGLTGLDHLEGLDVDVVVDGEVFYVLRVADGEVTLPFGAASDRIEAGLRYRSIIRTLEPETPTHEGAAPARLGRMDKIIVRFVCTGPGCHVGGEAPDTLEEYVPTPNLRHEDKIRTHLGWNRSQRVIVTQDSPFTMTVIGIEREITIGEGEESPP